MKNVIKILLLLGLVAYLGFAIVKFAHPTEDVTCEAVEILINDSLQRGFVTVDDIHEILTKKKVYAEGRRLSEIDLPGIDSCLEESPYIDQAQCHYTSNGTLLIQVTPQHPILHVMAQNGEDYYMDKNGLTMPTGNYNMDLCIATGNISKQFAQQQLAALAQFIYEDEFWSRQAQQIHVVSEKNIQIYPRMGNHVILLGDISKFQEKLYRMQIFYKKGFPKIGWNKYKTINLAFDNQVVCTRR